MRILVISDTHIPLTAETLPPLIEKEAKKSDCCLHAGDLISKEVLQKLSSLTKTYAVYGNMDDPELKRELPQKLIIPCEEVTIGLTHGRGSPANLIQIIQKEFAKEKKQIDIFVFGHTHSPIDREINGKIYFNPGSPTDTFFTPYRSYGILEIEGKSIKRRIIRIE
ncbi:MAG: metallophosphoesterase [Candidatus Omnitrophota bacterium]|nr:MAG: metallophosphoesterase [Candidatus Omnitrophota bacterium]